MAIGIFIGISGILMFTLAGYTIDEGASMVITFSCIGIGTFFFILSLIILNNETKG